MKEQDGVLYLENRESQDRVKITDINFLLQNRWYLSDLAQRGGVIISPEPDYKIVFSIIKTNIDDEKGILGFSRIYYVDLLMSKLL